MSKRKLNRRQAWRIKKIQAERADRAQKKAAIAESMLSESELGPEREGRVVAHYGAQLDVEDLDAPGLPIRCHLRANLPALVTGDIVVWRAGRTTGVVVAAQPRQSELLRPDASNQLKPVAANIDRIVIVIAPRPTPHANLIDRYLVAAENTGIIPVLLLNKADAIGDDAPAFDTLLSPYAPLGYEVLRASTRSGEGIAELKSYLAEFTSVFVGQSGVGKSSLVNALLPDAEAAIGELSALTGKGTHTTTTARLFHFPEGGRLIDSPGIREFGLWHMSREEVLSGFAELSALLGHCRFRDCQHQQEPGCALLEAVDAGRISAARWESCQLILNSLTQN